MSCIRQLGFTNLAFVIAALLLSFGVIFVAELGDKSQLMAMTYALRYRWWVVILAITVATTAVHAVSVFFGHFLGMSLPTDLMSVLAGLAMLAFGLWTIYGDRLDNEERNRASRVGASVFLAVMSAFFLAELGDKTMLATITIATDHDWLGVWIGSTVGMVAADAWRSAWAYFSASTSPNASSRSVRPCCSSVSRCGSPCPVSSVRRPPR